MNRSVKVFLKVFLSVILVGIIVAGVAFLAVFSGIIDTTSGLNLDEYDMDLSSYVYCIDPETGEYTEYERLYAEENRIWADLEEIPKHVQHAAVAIEDERFYSHSGVDFRSTAKATFKYLFKNSTARGGSTITQQLVKNLTGERAKSPLRKVTEMMRAIQLEKKLSKDGILELYLNSFYLGEGCNGIKSAALFYFDKDVSELTVAEGACLVGITQYPTLYDPLINPDQNKTKQELVLSKMYELKYIDKETYEEAVDEELVFVGKANSGSASRQSYFVDEIIRDVLVDLQDELGYTESVAVKMLYSGGLKIYSTVDPEIQEIVDDVFSNPDNLASGPLGKPQASMTVIDPYTGEVKALVGGFGEKTGTLTLNRATQAFLRQPGSSIKPIAVYGPAIEYGTITPTDIYEDKQITIGTWSPKNYYSGFKGKVGVKYAVQQSINTVPVQILQELGVNKSYDFMTKKLGVTSLVDSDRNLAALALGGLTKGISNLQITAAYCAFVNDGVYNTPLTYTKVEDAEGNILIEKKSKSNVAMKSATARTMNGLLKSVCDSGTGTPARFSGKYTIAGKTGTTDDDKDRWFVGYTPYYCAAVWVGYDKNQTVSYFTSNPTIPLWRKVMEQVHNKKKLPSKSFNYIEIPDVVIEEYDFEIFEDKICVDSGLKATSKCPESSVITEDASALEDFCPIHTAEEVEDNTTTENNNAPDVNSTPSTDNNNSTSKPPINIDDSNLSDTGL